MKKNYRNYHQQKGSSLLEVMISLIILAFFMLGNSPLMISTIESNRQARRITAATNLTLDAFETMRGLNYDAIIDGSDGPLTDSGVAAGVGAIYSRAWTVTNDSPVADSKTISITTSWTDKEGNQSIQIQSIVTL